MKRSSSRDKKEEEIFVANDTPARRFLIMIF